mmetsp:Transcript_25019/g.83863  ORF Transcript_25019/g.83863 Transcript_25019/m.83863 type:complete len:226 (+) Transcript_25019:915-1592(+)
MVLTLFRSLFRGLKLFIADMQTIRLPIQVWASLFPFPQLLYGGYLAATRGALSPAGLLFGARAVSFLVAGQVFLRDRMSKTSAPIMHLPFLAAAPLCLRWLSGPAAASDPSMARFLLASLSATALSLALDLRTAYTWLVCGQHPGYYVRAASPNPAHRLLLPLPSLALAAYCAAGPPSALDPWVLPAPAVAMAAYFCAANPHRGLYDYLLPVAPLLVAAYYAALR